MADPPRTITAPDIATLKKKWDEINASPPRDPKLQEEFRKQVEAERKASFEHALAQALGGINRDAVDSDEERRKELLARIAARRGLDVEASHLAGLGDPPQPPPAPRVKGETSGLPPVAPHAPSNYDDMDFQSGVRGVRAKQNERIAAQAEALGADIQEHPAVQAFAPAAKAVGDSFAAMDAADERERPHAEPVKPSRPVRQYDRGHGPQDIGRERVSFSMPARPRQATGRIEFDPYDPRNAPDPPPEPPPPPPPEDEKQVARWQAIQAFRNGRTGR